MRKLVQIMSEDSGQNRKYIMPNLLNSLFLLEELSKSKDGFTIQEMVRKTGIPKSTIFRICYTLQSSSYLSKNEETSKFFLSRKILSLGLSSLGEESIIEKSLFHMRELRDKVRETVLLGVLLDNSIALLDQVIGNHPFTFYIRPGKNFVMHASAPGKAVLAFLSPEEQEKILGNIELIRFNERTLTDRDSLMHDLQKVVELGYSIDRGEELDGVHCIGAPILDGNGSPVAVVWTTGPSGRLKESDFESVGASVLLCARRITKSLGYK